MFTMVIIISFLTDEFIIDRSPANKEEDLILVEYLSGLTLPIRGDAGEPYSPKIKTSPLLYPKKLRVLSTAKMTKIR